LCMPVIVHTGKVGTGGDSGYQSGLAPDSDSSYTGVDQLL
jgi:hypothetical protein